MKIKILISSFVGGIGSGILRDKTVGDNLFYKLNDDKQNNSLCKLKLLVEQFEHY